MTRLLGAPKRLWDLAIRHPLWTSFLVALVVRMAYVLISRPDPFVFPDSREYDVVAREILAGHGLIHPIGFVRPPLYPLFVAFCYLLGGMAALQAAQVVMGSASASLVAAFASSLQGGRSTALAAGVVAAVYPWSLPYGVGLASESLFTFLALVAFVLVTRATVRSDLGGPLLSGIAIGLAALARANILVSAPFIAAWWVPRPGGLRAAAGFLAGCAIALAPYTAYNLASSNGFVIASSGGGINFYVGNNPDTARLYDPDLPDDEWRELNRRSSMGDNAKAFLGCVEGTAEDLCEHIRPNERELFYYAAGLRYILSAPSDWALTELRKLIHFWRPWVEPRVYPMTIVVLSAVTFAPVLALAVLGVLRMSPASRGLVATLALAATMAAVVWSVQLRYRFALLDPVLIAAGAGPLADAAERFADRIRASLYLRR